MSQFRLWLGVASAAMLAGCADGLHQTAATVPTVSYYYSADDDPDEVADTAAVYCDDNYGRPAVLMNRSLEGDRYEATYACQ